MHLDQRIEQKLKSLQEKLIERRLELGGLPSAEVHFLQRQALISSIGASTRIENAVLTDHEVEWVDTTLGDDQRTTAFEENKMFILDKLSKDRQRSVEEVAGCRALLKTILSAHAEFVPLSQSALRGLHAELMRHYLGASHYAGAYKTVTNRVVSVNHNTGETHTVLEPAPPGPMTESAMGDLVDWYNDTHQNQTWPILHALEFVFRFLAIHPFQDGNGRLGRGLFLLALLQSGDKNLSVVVPCISIDRKIEQSSSRYYSVLQQCSGGVFKADPNEYKLTSLVEFFIRIVEEAIVDIDFYRKRFADAQDMSESARTVWTAFRSSPQMRLSVSMLEDSTELPRRTIQYNLKILVQKDFIQRLGKGRDTHYQLVF